MSDLKVITFTAIPNKSFSETNFQENPCEHLNVTLIFQRVPTLLV